MTTGVPKIIADYMATPVGQIMLEGAVYFKWDLQQKKIYCTGNSMVKDSGKSLTAEEMACPNTMTFTLRNGKWERFA